MAPRGLEDSYSGYRANLVESVRSRGIRDLAVLRAIGEVPRHLFVPPVLRARAYEDTSLPIGNGQTISQPFTQALALEALSLGGRERVLEIGTGSGYQTALLGRLSSQVFSVERVRSLAESARRAVAEAGVENVSILVGDGSLGWRAYAPFDAIIISAACPAVPQPLLDQLAPAGRLLAPLGGRQGQRLVLLTKTVGGELLEQTIAEARFVPLVGKHGFDG